MCPSSSPPTFLAKVLRPQPEWLQLQPPLAARLMASLWLLKFPPVGSPVSPPNFDSIPFELNLVLPLALPNSAKLQSWSDLRQLDELDLGPRLKKILIIFKPDLPEPCLYQFHKAESSDSTWQKLIPPDMGGPCSGSTSITTLSQLTG